MNSYVLRWKLFNVITSGEGEKLIKLTELSKSPTCINKFCDVYIVGYLTNLGQFVHINPMIGPVITMLRHL
jgi:hypothetical protein